MESQNRPKTKESIFMDDLTLHLEKRNIRGIDQLLKKTSAEIIDDTSFEVVPLVSTYLTSEVAKDHPKFLESCREVLWNIVEKTDPSETLLMFLEEMEISREDDLKFLILLEGLKRIFARHESSKKPLAFEWCVTTIRSYVTDLEKMEKEIENENENGNKNEERRIIIVYEAILEFLEPLVTRAELKSQVPDSNLESRKLRHYLLSLLVSLFRCSIANDSLKGQERSLKMEERLVSLTSRLTGNLLMFLKLFERPRTRVVPYAPSSKYFLQTVLFVSEENVPILCYANFLYVLFLRHPELVPQVYDPRYLLNTSLEPCGEFLKSPNLVARGLELLEKVLERLETDSLSCQYLQLRMHQQTFQLITKTMVFSESLETRKKSLDVFRKYFYKFNINSRYSILLHLYESCDHSGLLAFLTDTVKSSVVECLDQESASSSYFLRGNLKILLKKICNFPHGVKTDLLEVSEEIVAALNFIRFLVIRDRDNCTGIWDFLGEREEEGFLQKQFLEPLRGAIDLSRVRFQVKLSDLGEISTRKHQEKKVIDNVTITVGDQQLPSLPLDEKMKFCQQAINAIDVIQSILIRVNECIAEKKAKH